MDAKELGNYGEKIASLYLEKKGYRILEKNYVKEWSSVLKGEIDIIAKKKDVIVFIEVKSLQQIQTKQQPPVLNRGFSPEDRVNFKKQKQLIKLSQVWLHENKFPLDSKWQIDIISVRVDFESKKAGVQHFKNAFS